MKIKVKKLNVSDPRPKLPTRGSQKAAGLDLYSIETRTLRPGMIHMFPTGIILEIPPGHEGQVRPRSGLAAKHGITVLNAPGTIDEDYTGEAMVLLVNHSKKAFQIEEGMRIAQVVIAPVTYCTPEWVTKVKKTGRGSGGFGLTGLKETPSVQDVGA